MKPVGRPRLTIVSDVGNTDSGGKYICVRAGGFITAA